MTKKACKKKVDKPNSARGSLYNQMNSQNPNSIVTFSGVAIAGTGIRLARDMVLDEFNPGFDRSDMEAEVVSRGSTFASHGSPFTGDWWSGEAVSVRSDPSHDQHVGFRLVHDLENEKLLARTYGLSYLATKGGLENRAGYNKLNTVQLEKKQWRGKYTGIRLVFSTEE